MARRGPSRGGRCHHLSGSHRTEAAGDPEGVHDGGCVLDNNKKKCNKFKTLLEEAVTTRTETGSRKQAANEGRRHRRRRGVVEGVHHVVGLWLSRRLLQR